ncbi:DNA primase, partial [bacterium]
MSTIDDVRDRIDIVEVVGEYVALKRAGRIYRGLCPFHDERTPSFVVYPDSGNWRCFGACATGGNAFDFVMRVENIDFRAALEILARRAGVVLAPPSPAAAKRESERDRMLAATAAAVDFYHAQLMRGAAADPGRAYLRARAFGADVAQAFQLGWAPAAGTALVEHLTARGFGPDALVAAGLARPREGGGGVFDLFRGRLMIPIHDARGHAIGFGARTLDPDGVPKYLNSPQSPIFDKGHMLFGLHRAARAIRAGGVAVVVEGYTDVIRAHAAGFDNVVASLGTALTEHQVKLLKRFAGVIVLALDADAAGQAATLRGLEVAREAAAGDVVPVPTASGMVRYEHRLDVELRVAALPPGRDPDDVIRADPETWRAAVAAAKPLMAYLFDALTADLDLTEPRGRIKAADRLIPVIADIPDVVGRSAWLSRLAALIQIDERDLAARLPAAGGGGRGGAPRPSGEGRRAGGAT